MFFKAGIAAGLMAGASALPQAATTSASSAVISTGYPLPYSYNQQPSVNSVAVSSVAAYAGIPASEIPGATNAVPPVISSQVTGVTSHGPFSGTPTTTGALSNSPAGTAIPLLPPNPTALVYNPNGTLNNQQPIPYQPAGGLGTNGTEPVYRVQSDFDYQSILLGLYQEWIELDLFHNILATFSEEEFTAAGLTPSDRFLIEFMADQESGHATLLSSLLGGPGGATPQCNPPLLPSPSSHMSNSI
jgi:Ferritin-like domain